MTPSFEHTTPKGPTKVADSHSITISNNDKKSDITAVTKTIGANKISKTYTLSYPEASYISIHFETFNLPTGCALEVSDGDGNQSYVMEGLGRHGLGSNFWARHVNGEENEFDSKTYTSKNYCST